MPETHNAIGLRTAEDERLWLLQERNGRLLEGREGRFANLIGNSHAMRRVYSLIQQVARSKATVLILGESGVGKELIADTIHSISTRAEKPFIKFNCAALPESVVDRELFGYERGAFIGAISRRKGSFESAEGGTLFLDEVCNIPKLTQARLMQVLQKSEFERVGGVKPDKIDVRVLASSTCNLESLVKEGRFCEDLYYRLNVFPIHVPPLRLRKTDVLLLADHFAERFSKIYNKPVVRISTPATNMLMSYHWPGNVRELENSIERAVALSMNGVIHSNHLSLSLQTAQVSGTTSEGVLRTALDSLEKEMIISALKRYNGSMARAARSLDLTDRVMGLRVARYGINISTFRSSESS